MNPQQNLGKLLYSITRYIIGLSKKVAVSMFSQKFNDFIKTCI